MNKKYILPALILAGGLIFIFRNRLFGQNTSMTQAGGNDSGSGSTGGGTTGGGSGFPLNKGSKGANVRRLQLALLKVDSKSLPRFGVDGDFGSETAAAALKIIGKSSNITEADILKIENPASATLPNINERKALAKKIKDEWFINRNAFKMGLNGFISLSADTTVSLYKDRVFSNSLKKNVIAKANPRWIDLKLVDIISVADDGFLEVFLNKNVSNVDANIMRFSPFNVSIVKVK